MRTLCISTTTFLSLLIALQLVCAQSVFDTESYTSPTPTVCPAAVMVTNGGFDSGLAPWQTLAAAAVHPAFSIVSTDYNGGAHALQLEFPAANVTSWYFLQDIGLVCEGLQYFVSFAVNWLNFSIHGNRSTNFCYLEVSASYCGSITPTSQEGPYYATNTSGWQYHSFTCTPRKTGYATFDVGVGCEANYIIPAFTWQMTDFNIHLIVSSSTSSQPTSSRSTPTSSQSISILSQSPTTSPSTTATPPQSSTSSSSLISSSLLTPSITPSTIMTSSINATVGIISATTTLTSLPSLSNNITGIPTLVVGSNACRSLKTSFSTGSMGLILLLPYLLR